MRLEVGKCYFVRGGAKDYVGRLAEIDTPFTLTLADAAWVAESGRFHEFMRDGRAAGMEVEPCGAVMLRWEEVFPWPFPLFAEAV
jgi:hypothetical protein